MRDYSQFKNTTRGQKPLLKLERQGAVQTVSIILRNGILHFGSGVIIIVVTSACRSGNPRNAWNNITSIKHIHIIVRKRDASIQRRKSHYFSRRWKSVIYFFINIVGLYHRNAIRTYVFLIRATKTYCAYIGNR